MTDAKIGKRRIIILASIAVFITAFIFSIKGSNWHNRMHPDEIAMAVSLRSGMLYPAGIDDEHLGKMALYPQGFSRMSCLYTFIANIGDCVSEALEKCKDSLSSIVDQEHSSTHVVPDLYSKHLPKNKDKDNPLTRPRPSYLVVGRRLNAILAGVTSVFLFFATLVLTGSITGSICTGLLAGCSPFIIEHAHYCESDLGVSAMFSLAILTGAITIRRKSLWFAAAFAAACAAAFATKYSVAALAPFFVVVYIAVAIYKYKKCATKEDVRKFWRMLILSGLTCLAAGIAAYMIFTPVTYAAPQVFFKMMQNIANGIYGETAYDLTHESSGFLLRQRYIVCRILRIMKEYGICHILLLAASIPLVANIKRNKRSPFLLVLLALVVIFDISAFPWFRSQEFLPIVLIFSVIIGTGIGIGIELITKYNSRLSLCVAPLFIALIALVVFGDAGRMMNAFAWQDTRYSMRNWLTICSNPKARIASERYATPSLRGKRIKSAEVFGEAEQLWIPSWVDVNNPGHEYFSRTATHDGRNHRSPLTGKLYQEFQDGWDNFVKHANLLKTYDITKGIRPTFAQVEIELWGIRHTNDVMRLPEPLAPRGEVFYFGGETYYYGTGNDFIGPIESIKTVGKRARVRMTPPGSGKPLFAVTRHITGKIPAKIIWENLFEPREATIQPGKADWFILSSDKANAACGDIQPHTRIRMKGDDQTSLCLTTITDNPAYVAELLTRGGSPEKVTDFFNSIGFTGNINDAINKFVQPIPERFYNDFSRIFIGQLHIFPEVQVVADKSENSEESADSEIDDLASDEENQTDASEEEQDIVSDRLFDFEFPFVLNPGKYNVSMIIPKGKSDNLTFLEMYGDGLKTDFIDCNSITNNQSVTFTAIAEKTVFPRFRAICHSEKFVHKVELRNIEITW